MDKADPSCLSDSVAGRWQALPGLYLLHKDKESEGVVKVILCLPYELFFIFLSLFSQRHSMLKQQDLSIAMVVTSREVLSALSQLVPCVGCRRSVERLFSQLVESGNPALEPLTVGPKGVLSVTRSCMTDAKKLYTLFYVHG